MDRQSAQESRSRRNTSKQEQKTMLNLQSVGFFYLKVSHADMTRWKLWMLKYKKLNKQKTLVDDFEGKSAEQIGDKLL